MQLADREKTMIADYSHGMQKKLALAAAVIHGPRILFLDEPFEGVDALAAGALKALLGRMTERGVTIFLTSHVLEIVERLCSHVGIIHKGRLVAQGSLEELRAGVPGEAGEKKTLEQIFLSIVGQSGAEQVAAGGIDMADVARLPGVFEQIRLVAGVRWLILKNGLRKKNNVWDLIGMIWVGIVSTADRDRIVLCILCWRLRIPDDGTRGMDCLCCSGEFFCGGRFSRFLWRDSARILNSRHCCGFR